MSVESAFRLSPRDPQLPIWQLFAGVGHLHLGRHAQAIEWLARSVESNPKSAFGRLFLASALALAGRVPEARSHMAQFQQLCPGVTLARFRALEPSDAPAFRKQREHVYEGLRQAGMAE